MASRAGGCQRPGAPPVPASLSTVPVPCQEIPMIRMRTDFFAESLDMGTSMVVLMPQAAAGIGMEGADGAGGADGPGGSDAAGGADADGVPVLYLLHGLSDDCTIWERRTAIERYATAKGIAVVMPEVRRSFYADEALGERSEGHTAEELPQLDRKSTRLNSSHVAISYAVFCLKKKSIRSD